MVAALKTVSIASASCPTAKVPVVMVKLSSGVAPDGKPDSSTAPSTGVPILGISSVIVMVKFPVAASPSMSSALNSRGRSSVFSPEASG